MWIAPAFTLTVVVAVLNLNPGALSVAAPILALWLVSPLLRLEFMLNTEIHQLGEF
jgi:hypothetical protein